MAVSASWAYCQSAHQNNGIPVSDGAVPAGSDAGLLELQTHGGAGGPNGVPNGGLPNSVVPDGSEAGANASNSGSMVVMMLSSPCPDACTAAEAAAAATTAARVDGDPESGGVSGSGVHHHVAVNGGHVGGSSVRPIGTARQSQYDNTYCGHSQALSAGPRGTTGVVGNGMDGNRAVMAAAAARGGFGALYPAGATEGDESDGVVAMYGGEADSGDGGGRGRGRLVGTSVLGALNTVTEPTGTSMYGSGPESPVQRSTGGGDGGGGSGSVCFSFSMSGMGSPSVTAGAAGGVAAMEGEDGYGNNVSTPTTTPTPNTPTTAAADGGGSSHGSSAFRPYQMPTTPPPPLSCPRDAALLVRATAGLVALYRHCNDAYRYSQNTNPRRVLTKPSAGLRNDGYDNENSDLILHVNDVLVNGSPGAVLRRYVVHEMLGQGTFGQVVACWCEERKALVAVKVIKNQPAYYHQARVEIGLLQLLNTRCDPADQHRIVRMVDFFLFRKHLCLVFEKLDVNLFELLRRNGFRGLSLSLVQMFLRQLLDALVVLRDASIIHCDIKPENILLKSPQSGDLKLIDFGSACFENRTVYSYIQSRFYRSPEVVLGCGYNVAIDVWSLGCVAAELFLGLPLFPGASEHDLLTRIVQTFGMPPAWLLDNAKHADKFFNKRLVPDASGQLVSQYVLTSQAEFETKNNCKAPAGKRYFSHTSLPDIILVYPFKQNLGSEELDRERRARECFIDFLLGVLELDPRRRWTPRQAAAHPFITGEAFTGPFTPQPDPPRKSPHLLSYLPAESTPPVAVRSAITHQYQQQNQQQFTAGTSVGKATASSAAAATAASHQAVGSLGAFGNSAAMPTAPTSAGLPSASTPAAAAGRAMALPFANARTAASAAFGSLPSHGSESGLNQLHNASHSLSHLHGHLQAPYLPQQHQQHHHHQQQAAFIPGSSYTAPGGGGTAAMSMLQYSPAHHAQAHAQAHAIAMAALQQLSPNFSSMLAGSYVQGGGGGGASGCGMAASLGSSWQHPPSSQLLSGSFQTPGLAGSVPHALPPALGSSLSSHLPVVGSFPSGAYQGALGAATGQLSGAGGPPPLPPIQLGATPSTASFMQHHMAPWAAARAQQQQQLQQHLQQQQLQQQLQQQQQQLQQQGGLPSGIAAAAMVGNRRLSSSHATELVYSPAVATAAAAAATAAAAAAQQQQQQHALSLSGVGLASGEGSERISGGGAGSATAAAASAGTGNGQSSGGAAADALNAAAAAAAAARHQQSQLVQQQMQIQAAVAAVAAAAAAATAGGPSVYGTAGAGGQSDAIGSAAAAAAAAAVFGGSAGSGLPGTPQHAALLSSSLSQGNPAGGLDPLFMGALLQQQQKQQHDAVTSAAAAAAVAAAAAAASGGASSASHAAGLHLLNYAAGQQPLPHHHMHLQSHQHPHSQRQNPQPYPQPPGSFQHSYPTHPNNLLSSHHHHSHISQGGLAAQAAQVAASLAALHAQSGTLQPPYPGGPPFMMPHALGAAAAAASAAAGMGHISSHMALGAFGTVGAGGIGPPVPGGQSMLGVGGASAGGLVGAGLPHGGSFTSTTDNTDALFEMQTGATESGTSQQSLPGRNVPSTPADSPSINQVGSPGDWDPLYSDEQLLGEELPAALGGDYVRHNGRQGGARRRGSVSYSDIMLAQRPHDPTSGDVPPLLLQPEVQAQQPHAAMQHGPAVAGGPATAAAAAAAAISATVSAEAVGASVAAYRGSSAMMQSTPPPDRRSPSVGVCSDAYGRRSAMDWSSTPGLDVTGGTTGTGVGHGGHHPGMGPAGLGPAGGDVGHGDDEDTVGDSGVGGPGGGGGGNATPAVLGGADVPDVIAPGGSGGGGLCSTVHLASGDPGGGGGGASGSAGSGQGAAMGALGGIAHALLAAQQQQHQHTLGRFTTSGLGTAGTARLASSSGRPYGSSDGSGTVNMGGGAAVTAATTSASADGYWTAAMSSTLVNGGGSIAIPTPGTTPQYHPLYDTGALAAVAAAGSLQAPLMLAGSFQPLSSHYLLQQQQQQQQYLQQASQVRYALQQQQHQQQTALALEAAVGASTAGGGAHDTLSGMIRAHGSATTASASCEDLAGAFAAAVQQHQHQQQQQHQHQQQILQQLVASQHPAPTHHHTNQLQMQQQQHTQQQQEGAEMAALQPIESAAAAAAVAAAAFEQHQRQQQHQQMYVGSLPYSGLMPPVMSMLRQSEGQH